MKINILYKFIEKPWGGGNQFLKALKKAFIDKGCYEDNAKKADVILFNSHHELNNIARLKHQFHEKIFIHRVDGPMIIVRGKGAKLDKIIFAFNNLIADGTVFQSNWSRGKCFELGLKKNIFETTIINAPDNEIFNPANKLKFNPNRKIKLIATSWSSNWKKGFKVYQWLDEHLDFDKYEMVFIGNSPVSFKNIKCHAPLNQQALARELVNHDIFIAASQKDSCSNSLIEALHSNLPAVVLNDAGHIEIIGKGGCVFKTPEEIPSLIEDIVNNYDHYQSNIKLPDINEVGNRYYDFFRTVFEKSKKNEYKAKTISIFDYVKLMKEIFFWKITAKFTYQVGPLATFSATNTQRHEEKNHS